MIRSITLIFLGALGFLFLFWAYAPEADRVLALRALHGIKNVIYQEATLHNPEGDMVPDELDNTLLKHLKETKDGNH